MDKATAVKVQKEMGEALKAIAEKYNLVFQGNNAKFDAASFEIKMKFAAKTDSGVVMTEERRNLLQFGSLYGLGEALDKVITFNGRQFQITGLKNRDQKFPVTAKCLNDGKNYKLPVEGVKAALARG